MVPKNVRSSPVRREAWDLPLGRPVHDVVAGQQGRQDVENLSRGPPPRVEDGVVRGAAEGVLSVARQAEGDDALLLLPACL